MINCHRWTPSWILSAMALCALEFISPAHAQQEPQSPGKTTPQSVVKTDDKSATQKTPENHDPNKPQNDRLFGVLPNYLTVENASSLPPQTVRQKFKVEALSTFDPMEYPYIGVVAAIGQASNSEPAFGQGFSGYAKRYGAAFGDTMIGNFMTGAVFPSLLRQDPRFYQMGRGKFLHRAAYAAGRVFVIRSDSGQKQFNFSELLGNGVAAGISNAYHPAPRTFTNSLSVMWTQIGWDAVSFEMKEFWPDIRRALSKKKK
jgi:hypothetical protein